MPIDKSRICKPRNTIEYANGLNVFVFVGGAMSLSRRRNNLVFVYLYCALYFNFNILQFSPHYTYVIIAEHIEN